MSNELLPFALLLVLGGGFSQTPTTEIDRHKTYDQALRLCRLRAEELHVSGDPRRSFIANCISSSGRP
jgi:hypothetical protein